MQVVRPQFEQPSWNCATVRCAATLILSGGTTTMMAGGEESKAA